MSITSRRFPRDVVTSKIFSEWDGAGAPSDEEVYVEDEYGRRFAHGDVATDCHTVLAAAIARGGIVAMAPAGFKIATSLSALVDGIHIRGVPGRTVIDCDVGLIATTSGYATTTTTLASNASIGDTDVVLTDAAGYAIGDFLKIGDDQLISTFKQGEIVQVKDVVSNTITIHTPLFGNYLTTENAYVRKLTFTSNVSLSGLELAGPGATTDPMAISLQLAKNVSLADLHIHDWGYGGIQLIDCLDTVVDRLALEDVYKSGYGYGVIFGNASYNMVVKDSVFRVRGRHYIATGAGTGTYLYGGFPRGLFVRDCYFENSTDEAVNTHGCYYGPTIISGCRFVGCTKGIEVQNSLDLISDCHFERCGNGIEVLKMYTPLYPMEHQISDCQFYGSTNYDIYSTMDGLSVRDCDLSAQSRFTAGDLLLDGLRYRSGVGASLILYVYGLTGSHINRVTVRNVDFYDSALYAAHFAYVDDLTVENFRAKETDMLKTTGCIGVEMSDVHIIDCSTTGFYHHSVQDLRMRNCIATGAVSRGLYIATPVVGQEATPISLEDCVFTGGVASAISGYTNVSARNTEGYVSNVRGVLSGTFAIDSTGIKTVTIAHGMAFAPAIERCSLLVVQNTAVDDWAYNLLKIVAVDGTNVTAKINVSTASGTGSATAKMALHIG